VRAAIVGASGYTGAELVRLVVGHPDLELAGVYARRRAGERLAAVVPSLIGVADLEIAEFEPAAVEAAAEVAFTALPHGASAEVAGALVDRGVRVVDLSADFRHPDLEVYRRWYGEHPRADLIERAVLGLPELPGRREALAGAALIACPGCYVTASVLALSPLLEAGLIEPAPIVVDAKSGASGAGRSPGLATHLPEVGEGIRAYKVAGAHRHTPEIEALLGHGARVTFTPHLVPMTRGILAVAYARPTAARDEAAYRQALEAAYANEPFVSAIDPLPDTSWVRGSNRAHVGVRLDARTDTVIAMATIDNLVKGAAGQAVQSLNVAMGWDETAGLGAAPMFP
jgi:N-acetyl-gamma-glutamyl-phosphate reductase